MLTLTSENRGAIKMVEQYRTYQSLKEFRNRKIIELAVDSHQLNLFNDQLMQKVIQIAIERTKNERGDPPTSFAFFVMGSAGRLEQGICSDQDHGIIFAEDSTESRSYFQLLGNEITHGLHTLGYELCDGNVMCSNPRWCKSELSWQEQLNHWTRMDSWESIRHLLIFFDARVLVGSTDYIQRSKEYRTTTSEHLLKPCQELSPEIIQLTGITQEQINSAPPLSEVLVQFYEFIKKHVLVAHHANHEQSFMKNASWNLTRSSFRHRIVDTAFLIKITDPHLKMMRLEDCCNHCSIEIKERHHALGDAKMTAQLWIHYLKRLQLLGYETLRDVYKELAKIG
jgi:DNA polymerase III epsilon subunit-like protein